MCPGHSPCYGSGQYDPFGPPCLLCIEWMRCITNPLGLLEDKLACIGEIKAWVKRIIRRNRDHKINVTASSDPVILDYLKARKGTIPDTEPLARHLNAILWGIERLP